MPNPLTPIDFATYQSTSAATGPFDVYIFYPDGVWDEDKLTLAEAEAKYPKTTYAWNDVSDEM